MKTRPATFLLVFGLFWSALTLLFDGFVFLSATRQLLAMAYTSTEGTIVSSEVTHNHDSEGGTTHDVAVQYTYSVGDREFTGNRYRYGSMSSSDSSWAHALARAWAPGTSVQVYFDPKQPQDAVLQKGIDGGDLFMFAFMTPFNAVMLGFWWAGWAHVRRLWFKPVAGGVKLIADPRAMRARLTTFPPVAVAVAVAALAAFLSIFVVGFTSGGFHPTVRKMSVTWFLIVVAGAVGGLRQLQRTLSGTYDLVIDELGRALELPLTRGRKVRRRVPFSSVVDVRVERVQKSSSDGEQAAASYAPTLIIQGPVPSSERLVEWYDARKAEEFVLWLRQKLEAKSPAPITR